MHKTMETWANSTQTRQHFLISRFMICYHESCHASIYSDSSMYFKRIFLFILDVKLNPNMKILQNMNQHCNFKSPAYQSLVTVMSA